MVQRTVTADRFSPASKQVNRIQIACQNKEIKSNMRDGIINDYSALEYKIFVDNS
jgi:hypothetical protein